MNCGDTLYPSYDSSPYFSLAVFSQSTEKKYKIAKHSLQIITPRELDRAHGNLLTLWLVLSALATLRQDFSVTQAGLELATTQPYNRCVAHTLGFLLSIFSFWCQSLT